VQSAGVGSSLPPRVSQLRFSLRIVNPTRDEMIPLNLVGVTTGYLESLGARLVAGRLFEDADALRDAPVIVISEAAARQFFPGKAAIGSDLPFGLPGPGGQRARPRVIGVIADIKFRGLEQPAGGGMYRPWKDLPAGVSYLAVRGATDPSQLVPAVRDVVRSLDAQMPIPQLRTLGEEVAESIAERRLRVVPAIAFAVLSLAVALVGLAGSLSRAVAERRREIAIRAAVGATPRQAISLIVRDGAAIIVGGLALGVGASALAGRGLARMLYGVSPYDPATFAGVALLMAATTLAACYVPARRAAQIEPLELMRE
jgi:ABC-type antimicrobial peptide transport system permease subunit